MIYSTEVEMVKNSDSKNWDNDDEAEQVQNRQTTPYYTNNLNLNKRWALKKTFEKTVVEMAETPLPYKLILCIHTLYKATA